MTRLLQVTLIAALTAAPVWAADPTADTVVATVNGKDITLGHMIAMRESLPQQYQTLPDDQLFKGILDQLVQQTALAAEGEVKMTKRDTLALENQRRDYLSNAVLGDIANAAVTDATLQKLFDEKFADAAPSKEFDASHILVDTEQAAKDLKAKIDAGGDFAALAKENSTDKGSAENGGDLGWFGLGMMVAPFEAEVLKLEKGQVSAPIQTQFGWHIIKLNDTRVAKGPTLDEKRDELSKELQEKAIQAKLTEVTGKAEVKKSTDGIDPAILKNTDLLTK